MVLLVVVEDVVVLLVVVEDVVVLAMHWKPGCEQPVSVLVGHADGHV